MFVSVLKPGVWSFDPMCCTIHDVDPIVSDTWGRVPRVVFDKTIGEGSPLGIVGSWERSSLAFSGCLGTWGTWGPQGERWIGQSRVFSKGESKSVPNVSHPTSVCRNIDIEGQSWRDRK